jgi:hypothetical protein
MDIDKRLPRVPDGLPDSLLALDSRGMPRFQSVLPRSDRPHRKYLVKKIKQLSPARFAALPEAEAMKRFFSNKRYRSTAFWALGRRMPRHTQFAWPVSLDLVLLDRVRGTTTLTEFSETEFAKICPVWDEVKSRIERLQKLEIREINRHALRYLMLWPVIAEKIKLQDEEPDSLQLLLEGCFALSSITNSPWFLNQALELRPAYASQLGTLFAALPEADDEDTAGRDLDDEPAPGEHDADEGEGDEILLKKEPVPQAVEDSEQSSLHAATLRALSDQLAGGAENWIDLRVQIAAELRRIADWVESFDPKKLASFRYREALAGLDRLRGELEKDDASVHLLSELEPLLADWRARAEHSEPERRDEIVAALVGVLEQAEQLRDALRAAVVSHAAIHAEYKAALATASGTPGREERLRLTRLRNDEGQAEVTILEAQAELVRHFQLALRGSAETEVSASPETAPASYSVPEGAERVTSLGGAEEISVGVQEPINAAPEEQDERAPPTAIAPLSEARSNTDGGSARSQLTDQVVPRVAVDEVDERVQQVVETAQGRTRSAPSEREIDLARRVWGALAANRVSLAYQYVLLAAGEGGHVPESPPEPLVRAVAYADHLMSPDGELARAVTEALSVVDSAEFGATDDAVWASQLILVAALLRPLLLAPDSAAPALAERIRLPDGCSGLYRLFEEYRRAADRVRHFRLGARALSGLRDEGQWRADVERLESELREWRTRAPQTKIKFQAATDIWRKWLQPGGQVDQLLSPIDDEGRNVQAVRQKLSELRDPRKVDALLAESDRKASRRGEAIHGAAREQFHARVSDACGLAEAWVALMDAKPQKEGTRQRDLEQLRNALSRSAPAALEELLSLTQRGERWVSQAARVTYRSLQSLTGLFGPGTLIGDVEHSPQLLLHRARIEFSTLPIRFDWSLRGQVLELSSQLPDAEIGTPDIISLFNARVEQGDVQGAARLVEVAAVDRPEHVAQLRSRLDGVLSEYWAGLRERLAKLRESLEYSLVYGLISEHERDSYDRELVKTEPMFGAVPEADAIEDKLYQVGAELSEREDRRRDELSRRLEKARMTADAADIATAQRALDARDLPAATEYVGRIESRQSLTTSIDELRDPFNELYGASGGAIAAIERFLKVEAPEHKARKLHVEAGKPVGPVSFAGKEDSAAGLLEMWQELKRAISSSGSPDSKARVLQRWLAALGFSNAQKPKVTAAKDDAFEADFECDVVAARSLCPSPYFGSSAQGRYRAICFATFPGREHLMARLGPTATGRPCLVFCSKALTERERRELAAEARDKRRSFVLVDDALVFFLSAESGSKLPALFACALPFCYTEPYTAAGSLVAPEMFFGREAELRSLLDPMGSCFVYGGRQLGKTALLKHAERMFHDPGREQFASWIDLKVEHIGWSADSDSKHVWVPIWKRLRQFKMLPESVTEPTPNKRGRVEKFVDALDQWLLAHPSGRILLLLDEADRFLDGDARNSYEDTTRLKGLMERSNRRFKVVLAGVHNVLRTAAQANHPLGHFDQPIEIGPLNGPTEWHEARRLVRGPLAVAGFALEKDRLVDRILAQTNFYPSLVQLYCQQLINRMMDDKRFSGGPRFVIRESIINDTYLSKDLRDEIRRKFQLTLQLDQRYAVIAYAIAFNSYLGENASAGSYSASELAAMARDWWKEGFARTSDPELRIILDEMCGLGILRRVESAEGNAYTLRNPNLLLLMGTAEEVYEELQRERELPDNSGPQEFHAVHEGKGAVGGRHPLTLTQLAELESRSNEVIVFVGTEAAGVGRLLESLVEHRTDSLECIPLGITTDVPGFVRELARVIPARKTDATTVFIVPNECPWNGRWIQAAHGELKRFSSKDKLAKIVFIADPSSPSLHEIAAIRDSTGARCVTLRPWSEGFVRAWLEESRPSDGKAEREALYKRTGFWPALLERPSGEAVPLATFVGARAEFARLISELADMGELGSSDLAELAGLPEAEVGTWITAGIQLGLIVPAERGNVRLEPGLATLYGEQRISRG